ncbi:hypothetical protein H9P43_004144 [Blastocladiella emersonii ATCC 22665]|nr:hypothetical protein H9P43_004144 [Blastocladiella emersonii ATCC 22665]
MPAVVLATLRPFLGATETARIRATCRAFAAIFTMAPFAAEHLQWCLDRDKHQWDRKQLHLAGITAVVSAINHLDPSSEAALNDLHRALRFLIAHTITDWSKVALHHFDLFRAVLADENPALEPLPRFDLAQAKFLNVSFFVISEEKRWAYELEKTLLASDLCIATRKCTVCLRRGVPPQILAEALNSGNPQISLSPV